MTPPAPLQPTQPLAARQGAAQQPLFLGFNDQLPFKDPGLRYLVLAQQRTGANYLCARLCNVQGRFGMPAEYLSKPAIDAMAPRLLPASAPGTPVALGRLLHAVERARTTADGMFGLRLDPTMLPGTPQERQSTLRALLGNFDRIVLLTRADKLGQAIAAAMGQAGLREDGPPPALEAAAMEALLASVARNLARMAEEENMLLLATGHSTRPLLRITHEELEHDGQAAFMRTVQFLAGEGAALGPLDESGAMPAPPNSGGSFAQSLRGRFTAYISGTA